VSRRAGLPSALFPFMSVLACTIGALVVLLAVIALAAVDTTQASQAEDRQRAVALARARADFEEEHALLERALERWDEVDRALELAGVASGGSFEEIAVAVRRANRDAAIAEALDEARAEAARLADELGEVEVALEVLASRRAALPILIDPTGLSARWQPFFIECEAEGITAIRARDDFRHFVARTEIALTGDLARYLRRARSEPGALLVLLVRPNGLSTERDMVAVAREAGLRVARLPVAAGGELDWRLLLRAEAAR